MPSMNDRINYLLIYFSENRTQIHKFLEFRFHLVLDLSVPPSSHTIYAVWNCLIRAATFFSQLIVLTERGVDEHLAILCTDGGESVV